MLKKYGLLTLIIATTVCTLCINQVFADTFDDTTTGFSKFDYSERQLLSSSRLNLDGVWCFNWQEFVKPDEVCKRGSYLMSLPSKWNQQRASSRNFPRQGYASYSTTIILPKSASALGLYIPLFYRAGEFFVNGKSVLKVGQVGANKESETPRDKRSIIALPEGEQVIDLVVHVSSFHHIDGGLHSSLEIAPLARLQKEEQVRSFSSTFLVGSSLSFASYFLLVGLSRISRKDFVYVAGAAAIFTYTMRIIGTEQVWLFLVPDIPAFWTIKFEYYGLVLGLPAFLYYLYYLFPGNVNKLLCKGLLTLGLLSSLMVTFLPTEIYVWIRDVWVGLFAIFMLYSLYCIAKAILQKQTDSYIVGGITIIAISITFHDLFIWFNMLSGNRLINLTYLFLLLSNAVILSLRMMRSAKRETILSDQIAQLNIGLQNKVNARTRELAEKVEEASQQRLIAEQANSAKSKFLATASHDLRQPLHALGLFIGSLRFSSNNQDKADIQEKLETTHASLTELFDSLLDVSKIDADAIDTEIQTVAVKPMLQKIVHEFETSATNKGVQLRLHANDFYVASDPLWLERIIRNLLSNALRYTKQGGVLLALRERKDKILIQVWDTGIGIPKAQQSHIFAEFTQLKNPNPAGRLGLGLGLSIVQKLCVLLGLNVTVHSKVGQGSVFTIEAPKAEPVLNTPNVSQQVMGANQLSGKVILVVDDEALILEAMSHMLEKWGCTVLTANSMIEVKSIIETQLKSPDILITDYRFPENYTGLDIIQSVRQDMGKQLPALMVTGDTSKDKVALFKEVGVRVLHKPVKQAKLRMMLNHLSKEFE